MFRRAFSPGLTSSSLRLVPARCLSSLTSVDSPAQSALSLRPNASTWTQVKNALESTAIDNKVKMQNSFLYRVKGSEMQFIEIDLDPSEAVRAEVGSLFWMQDGIEFETTTGGGLMSGFKRMMTGESFFISDFVNKGTEVRTVAFSPNHPTKIVPVSLPEHGGKIIAQKGAFLCGSRDTIIELFFTKTFGAGFFGGEGFILQSISGSGIAFLKGGGGMWMRELEEGESLQVSGGSLVAFEESVEFEVNMVKGGKNILFGGEGLFLTRLTGPGKVWLQGMPFSKLAESVGRASGGRGGMTPIIPIGGGGGGGGETAPQGPMEDSVGSIEGGDGGGVGDILDGGDGGGVGAGAGGGGGGGGGWFNALFGDDE